MSEETLPDGTEEPEGEELPLRDRILAVIASIRPYLQRDGGDIEFVRFEESTRTCEVRMVGSCEHCALAPLTLRAGVEKALIYRVPEIRRVERVR